MFRRQVFRADRLATLYLFRPLREWVDSRRSSRIPILMYHSVSDCHSNAVHPYFETTTSPSVFAEQMKLMREIGYRTISLNAAVKYLDWNAKRAEPSVVLTFDDGLQDFATEAFPILQKYGFSATVFLATGYIGDERRQFNNRACLTWREVRELHRAGVTFGSHTVTHPQLRFLTAGEMEREIGHSKETIEEHVGHSVESFSYPFAFPETDRPFRRRLKDLLAAQGYRNGVSTIIGTSRVGDDEFVLPRLPVNSWDDVHLFQAKLEGGYDWLHPFQYAAKLARFGVR